MVGSFSSGGTTTEGGTGNLGLSLRTTIAGGVICSFDSLGRAPLGAFSLSRSPPPPAAAGSVFGNRHRK